MSLSEGWGEAAPRLTQAGVRAPAPSLEAHLAAEEPHRLARDLAGAAGRLASARGISAVLAAVVREAVGLVPGADRALVSTTRDGVTEVLATAGPGEAVGESLCLGLPLPGDPSAALRLYPGRNRPLSREAAEVAGLFAVHARLAVERSRLEVDLQRVAASRSLIGQAVGMLVERRSVTPDEAFAALVRCSQNSNVKVREVARLVVETRLGPEQLDLS